MSNSTNKIKYLKNTIEKVIIPVESNYYTTGDIIVKIGDRVFAKQALTKNMPDDQYSISIHSPIDGIVTKIDYFPVINQAIKSNNKSLGIEITANKNIGPLKQENKFNNDLNINLLLDTIKSYGIIGLGGAGFPTAKKLEAKKINTLVINAMECEQPIQVDNTLIINHGKDIIDSLKVLNQIIKPSNIIIAIKNNMSDAMNILQKYIEPNANIQLKIIDHQYPSGYSKSTIKLATNIDIKHNQHSSEHGIICLNIATIYAIGQALIYQQPLTHRLVTLILNNTHMGEYSLPIGTTLNTILRELEVDDSSLSIICGGNHMGTEIFKYNNSDHLKSGVKSGLKSVELDILNNISIDKTTQCIQIVSNNPQSNNIENINNHIKPCIKCGFCADACPIGLLPQQLYWYGHNKKEFSNNIENLNNHYLNSCIECGLCDQACPSNIPLTSLFKHLKSKLKIHNHSKYKANQSKLKHEFTQQRREELTKTKNSRLNKLSQPSITSNIVDTAEATKPNINNKKQLLIDALTRAKTEKIKKQK